MATMKSVWLKKLINGISTKVFAISHIKSIYYNYAENKFLSDKLDDMDKANEDTNLNIKSIETNIERISKKITDIENIGNFKNNVTAFEDSIKSISLMEAGMYYELKDAANTVSGTIDHLGMLCKYARPDTEDPTKARFFGIVFGIVEASSYTGTSSIYNLPVPFHDFVVKVTDRNTGDSKNYVIKNTQTYNGSPGFTFGVDEDNTPFLVEFQYYGSIRSDLIPNKL